MTSLLQVAENVAIDLLDGLGQIADPTRHAMVVEEACRGYAVIAACYLQQRHDQALFRTWLALGAQTYGDWLGLAPTARQTHAHAEPFLYAVLAGDLALADLIHQRLRADFNQGSEYEEDFAFARVLHLMTCRPEATDEVNGLLEFWRGVSGGGEPEFAIAEALLARDSKTLTDLLTARLDVHQGQRKQAQREDTGDPDERLALGRLDLEVAALVTIAQLRLGMPMVINHRLLPTELMPRALVSQTILPPRAWRDEERYHLYRDH